MVRKDTTRDSSGDEQRSEAWRGHDCGYRRDRTGGVRGGGRARARQRRHRPGAVQHRGRADPARGGRGAAASYADFGEGQLDEVPTDPTYVLHFAVAKTNDWDADLRANAEGVGLLMAHTKAARAFLHCSTTGVYQDTGGGPYKEDDPLGDNHRVSPFLQTYSISKIAAEAAARLSRAAVERADHDRPAQRAVRRQRRLAGDHADAGPDGHADRDSGWSGRPRTTRSTRTTSSR